MKSDALEAMPPIRLEEMDTIRLMNRVDSKFLTDSRTLETILQRVAGCGYMVLEADDSRVGEYRTMYYDTPQLQMYLDHHNRRLTRQKVRIRCYARSGVTFLELKSKNNHGRTKKKRTQTASEAYGEPNLDEVLTNWLQDKFRYDAGALTPALETVFSRITLVNAGRTERSTIDFGLSFRNVRNGACADMGGLVIIEVKQDGNLPSELRDILLECRVKPVRISKYCIGTAMTDADVKKGRFKQKLMTINKLKKEI